MKTNSTVVERITTDSKLFAHTRWDAIPVAAGLLHCAYFFGMFYLFPRVPLWVVIILGLIYSISISWNINGISHNFIHNPYFRSPVLNRLFSILLSITVGFSQIFYECIHMQHHKGNADLPDEHGETVDWISIYKHGHDGDAEHPFKYAFFSFFREDPKTVFQELKRKDPREAFWGVVELTLFVTTFVILGILNWRYICFHWTRMQAFRDQIVEQQRAAGVRVIKPPHALGFLDPNLPPHTKSGSMREEPHPI